MTHHDQRAFMLLEVVLAMSLLAIGLFAIIEGLSRCVAATRSVQNYAIAGTLLANKSYEFRVERPTDMLDQEGTFDDYPRFTWRRSFESTDVDGLWKQTITVGWNERGVLNTESVVDYRYLPQKQR
jgi:Tfp pilus assembly protein PilV